MLSRRSVLACSVVVAILLVIGRAGLSPAAGSSAPADLPLATPQSSPTGAGVVLQVPDIDASTGWGKELDPLTYATLIVSGSPAWFTRCSQGGYREWGERQERLERLLAEGDLQPDQEAAYAKSVRWYRRAREEWWYKLCMATISG